MKTSLVSPSTISSLCLALVLGLAADSGRAQTNTAQYLHEQRDGNRDNYDGVIGGTFKVGTNGVLVSHLGYYSTNVAGLNRTHNVGIFTSGGALLGSVLVPAGVGSVVSNGYSWVGLNPPLYLSSSTKYVVAAEVFSGDGDVWPDSTSYTNFNTYFIGTNASICANNYSAGGAIWPTFPGSSFGSGQMYGVQSLASIPIGPPLVVAPVTNVTTGPGIPVSVLTAANGQYPLTYYWYESPGTLLPSQTNATLVFANPQITNSGTYYVVVSNSLSTIQSSNIYLSVVAIPVSITRQPTNLTVFEGFPATFTVGAAGTAPIYYQWSRNGSAVNGATNNTYLISAAALSNNGDVYSCVVSNVANSIAYSQTSSNATLTVIPNQSPVNHVLHETSDASLRDNDSGTVGGYFTVGAANATVTHLAFYCTNTISGLNSAHYVGIFKNSVLKASVQVPAGLADGTNVIAINNYYWVALPQPLVLTNGNQYVLAAQVTSGDGDFWPDVFAPTNWDPFYIGTTAVGTRACLYGGAWPAVPTGTFGGNNIYGAGNLGALALGAPAVVALQSNVVAYVGSTATMSVSVDGAVPTTIQWFKGSSVTVTGQTESTLTLTNLQLTDGNTYYAVGSNAMGTAQSSNITLTVYANTAPIIQQQPQPQSAYINQSANFAVTAIGEQPLTYQWYFGSSPIAGATNSSVSVTDTPGSVGSYSVAITNALGGTNSASASLSITTPAPGSYAALVAILDPLVYYQFSDADPSIGTNGLNLGSLGPAWNCLYEGGYFTNTGPQPPQFPQFDSTNMAIELDGSDTDARIPGLSLNTNAWAGLSMAAWVNMNGGLSADFSGVLFNKGAENGCGIEVRLDTTNGVEQLIYTWNGLYFGNQYGLDLPQSGWAFVAMSVQTNQAILYVQNGTNWLTATNTAPHVPVQLNSPSYVGWDTASGSSARRFFGEIDEPTIFGRALSPAEVMALYTEVLPVTLTITKANGNVTLTWPGGQLQQAGQVNRTYSDVSGATSPYTVPATNTAQFFRIK